MKPFFRPHTTARICVRRIPLEAVPRTPRSTPKMIVSSLSSQNRGLKTSSILSTENHDDDSETLLNRHSLNPTRIENSQSGTDSEIASHDAPFDPSNTAPESEMEATAKESSQRNKQSNPLDVSPANRDVNEARDPSGGQAERGADKPPSARGQTRKNKPVN